MRVMAGEAVCFHMCSSSKIDELSCFIDDSNGFPLLATTYSRSAAVEMSLMIHLEKSLSPSSSVKSHHDIYMLQALKALQL